MNQPAIPRPPAVAVPPQPAPSAESPTGGELAAAAPKRYPDLPPAARAILNQLIRLQLLGVSAVHDFLSQNAGRLRDWVSAGAVGEALVGAGLLTPYQMSRVLAGTTYGLVLGNYRVLDRLGSGTVGVVFLAEHILLRRRAAVKVVPVDDDLAPDILDRFYAEMRVLAEMEHPHVVTAYDAGTLPAPMRGQPALHYLVMELVPGGDLEEHVYAHGLPGVPQACEWIRQAASGLQEAHDHHLIHRDLKPSNLLLTAAPAAGKPGQVKLVDFGLARQFCSTLTDPRMLLGSLEFMAPEQSIDPSAVGPAADIYGLGATLFWLLTGQTPFVMDGGLAQILRALQHDRPRRLSQLLPDVPPELDAFVATVLDRDPHCRPALPVQVMNALARFASPATGTWDLDLWRDAAAVRTEAAKPEEPTVPAYVPHPSSLILSLPPSRRVLVVGAEEAVRSALSRLDYECVAVADAAAALERAAAEPFDVVVLAGRPADADGPELCRQLRERKPAAHLKIILWSDADDPAAAVAALAGGADDVLATPAAAPLLAAKVERALRWKDAQERADRIGRHLLTSNRQLEQSLLAHMADVRQAQDAMLFAMVQMAQVREGTMGPQHRLAEYVVCLAERLRQDADYAGTIDSGFLDNLRRCVALLDIGTIGLPDAILRKPGPLTQAERKQMETHPLLGGRILDGLGEAFGDALPFLGTARAIVLHHHERYDGSGYPDGLNGDRIPLAARLVALADAYDSLRQPRPYRPALAHEQAVEAITRQSPGQFDPAVLQAFAACQDEFQRISQTGGR